MDDTSPPHHESPSQTAGPYVHIGCTPGVTGIELYAAGDLGARMKTGPVKGEEVVIEGVIYDGAGAPVLDAMVEIWQADAQGLFASANETRGTADPNFRGWGRAAVDMETGLFRFDTLRPGRVPAANGELQAPHISMWIVARGINIGLQTRIYFADDAAANGEDPLLRAISDRSRLRTLMAQPVSAARYRFDVHLQGDDETVFLDI